MPRRPTNEIATMTWVREPPKVLDRANGKPVAIATAQGRIAGDDLAAWLRGKVEVPDQPFIAQGPW
ncbi:hypothetical protein [Oceaniglobus trochenteri]|uniref:hypothetical protein n=1 Tax=Oceaniglobus trochenteri TaxID=2763260 RepID=UPI001CFFFC49|nr:hypothetical protein [Oceaniglobus trochenteri]